MTGQRLLSVLVRNAAVAAVLALIVLPFAPREGGLVLAYADALVALLVFMVLGYYVELVLLRIPGIETGLGRAVRVTGWFAGGLWCYVAGRAVWRLLGHDASVLPLLPWGGVLFIVVELLIHALLRASGRPNFYTGGEAARYGPT